MRFNHGFRSSHLHARCGSECLLKGNNALSKETEACSSLATALTAPALYLYVHREVGLLANQTRVQKNEGRPCADKSKWGEFFFFCLFVSVPIKEATIIEPQTKVNYGKLHDPMSGCLTFCTTMRKDSLEYDPASQGSDAIAGNGDNKLYKIPHPYVCTSLYKTACAY